MTPRRFSSGVSVASLFRTPRGLNDPVRCKSSALNQTFAPQSSDNVREESSGVRCKRPSIRRRAAWTSSRESNEPVTDTPRSYSAAA
jgi:hypothetical protein